MTLFEVIRAAEAAAARQPSVNMVVRNDIFRLNTIQDAKYGVFAWTQGQHQGNLDGSVIIYQFTFFYVDRLTSDKSNEVEVQSVGVETLTNILRSLDDMGVYLNGSYTLQPFNQRFLDECAGVFTNVRLEVPVGSVCTEDFPDTVDGLIIR